MIPYLIAVREISPFDFLELCSFHLQMHSLGGPSQISKLYFFVRIVNSFELTLLTIFAKVSL